MEAAIHAVADSRTLETHFHGSLGSWHISIVLRGLGSGAGTGASKGGTGDGPSARASVVEVESMAITASKRIARALAITISIFASLV